MEVNLLPMMYEVEYFIRQYVKILLRKVKCYVNFF